MELPAFTLAGLVAVAAVAGFVDAIGGGGGLLTLPALLAAGLPPHLAFGTNKGASVFGSSSALFRFWRSGLILKERVAAFFSAGVCGALIGAGLLQWVKPDVLRPMVLVLLVGAGVVVAFVRPTVGEGPPAPHAPLVAGAIALVIGAYDGFFGPGTGTFLIIAMVTWLKLDLRSASANAKVVNFASNLAAVAMFQWHQTIVWQVAVPMALGQLVGGTLGAQWAITGGDRVVRRVVLVVVLGLVGKLSYDLWVA